ncbi:MAG: gluconate 2-dehydrogenase subunit 3 family protein [Ignavibacteriaceae bacterium]|jgi:gluconate 2-dehydrogenase gamma chain
MAEGNKLSRRDFIKISTLSAGALAVAAGGVRLIESFSTAHRPGTLFFTEHEYKLVEAIAEQIIPADNWPGGKDAGVANFIDLQLTGPYRRFQEDYRKGLAALENTCLNKFHSRFENISWDSQTSLLQDMEAGRLEEYVWRKGFSAHFFELLRSHSLQGYYGSPRHGGNKNFISYKMIGLDEPQIVGENRDGI